MRLAAIASALAILLCAAVFGAILFEKRSGLWAVVHCGTCRGAGIWDSRDPRHGRSGFGRNSRHDGRRTGFASFFSVARLLPAPVLKP